MAKPVIAAIDNQLRRVNSGMFAIRPVPAAIGGSVPSGTKQIVRKTYWQQS
jgi:hypothetical protein